jgi:DNA-binding MarR family transcriptional regulator
MSAPTQSSIPETSLELSILRSLRRIQRAVADHGHVLVEGYHVTMPQLLCLRQLAALGTTGPNNLAAELGVSQATISGMIDRLEARGYVRRSRSSIDKRKVMLDLTDRGMELEAAAPSLLQEKLTRGLQRRAHRWGITIDLVLRELLEMMGEGDDLTEPPLLGSEGAAVTGPPDEEIEGGPRHAQDD